MCIDYHKMNKVTIADQHPIPKQMDILVALSGAQYQSVFDTLSGFTQLEFDKELRHILPFILIEVYTNLNACPSGGDIVVYSCTFEDHLKHVDLVLKRLLPMQKSPYCLLNAIWISQHNSARKQGVTPHSHENGPKRSSFEMKTKGLKGY